MLQCGKGYAMDIQSLTSIYSVRRGYAPLWQRICSGHILFEEDMLRQEGICSTVAKDRQCYAQSRGDMLNSGKGYEVDRSSLKKICSIKR